MAGWWEREGRLADTIAILTFAVDTGTALFNREHVARLAREQTLSIIIIVALLVAGLVAIVRGFILRMDTFSRKRGHEGASPMWAGIFLLLGALTVFLVVL